jgi:pimeloyl-ACP methyl ester carboxylesterase
VLLPGLDGTGLLLEAFVAALPPSLQVTVVRYPVIEVMGYDALAAVARASLPPVGPVVLVGESFSGPVAVTLAAENPTRVIGLILCCSFVRSPRPLLSALRWVLHGVPIGWIPRKVMAWGLYGNWNTPQLQRDLAEAVGRVSPRVTRARWIAALGVDVREKLAQIRVPVMVMSALRDRVVPRSAAKEMLRGFHAEEVMFEAPHGLLQVMPEEAARVVADFARSVGSQQNPV